MKKRVTITFQPEEWLLARIEEYKKEFPNGSLTQFIHRLIREGQKKAEPVVKEVVKEVIKEVPVEIVKVLCPEKGIVTVNYCMKECPKPIECPLFLQNRELTLSYNVT